MAEYEERSLDDLTEEPSQHRIEELRNKGTVAQSRELNGTLVLLGVILCLYFTSNTFLNEITSFMKDIFTRDMLSNPDAQNWRSFVELGTRCAKILALCFLPIAVSGMILGVLSSVAQVGFFITTETLNPDFKRVDPISGFFRIFSLKSLTEGFKSILKFTILIGAVYFAVKNQLGVFSELLDFGAGQILAYMGATAFRIFGVVIVLLFGVAAFDYWIQWRRFRQQAMMTKAEAKKELKEREGDPQIKARIRSIQREVARKRMMKAVPTADVVITNPTHFAIAIIYDPAEGFAPKVIAKGADFLAERIKKIAREHGIPTVENKPLARTLYKHVKVGQMIPRSLYQAVAEILAYVYRLKGKRVSPGQQDSTDRRV